MKYCSTADKNKANVKIDRTYFRVDDIDVRWLGASLLREMAECPADRDLWEVVPGECDRKVTEHSSIPHFPNALRQFFTAPKHVTARAR